MFNDVDSLELYEQFKNLKLGFPNLNLEKQGNAPWFIRGGLRFSAIYDGQQINDEYSIKITVPGNYPDELPTVQEMDNRIPNDFHHYQNDNLCLGAPIAVKYKFRKEPTLVGFVCNCVVPYLYSFSYKVKFGKMPFGELSHGALGILEYYKDLFGINDNGVILKLLEILAEDNCHEQNKCPCGSKKRLFECHGKTLLEIKDLQSRTDFQSEYRYIGNTLIEIAIKTPFLYGLYMKP